MRSSLLAGGAGLLVAATAAGGGFYFGHALSEPELADARTHIEGLRHDQARLRVDVATMTEELLEARGRETLLEARRQLALAIDELDSRNFGLVQRHCDASAALLRANDRDDAVSGLAGRLERYQVGSGANFDTARGELRAVASSLDGLVMPVGTGSGEAAPTGAPAPRPEGSLLDTGSSMD